MMPPAGDQALPAPASAAGSTANPDAPRFVIRYRGLGKLLVIVGPLLFLPLVGLSWAAALRWSPTPLGAVIGAGLGAWLCYLALVAGRCAAFADVRIEGSDEGLTIRHRGTTRTVPWPEIGDVERHRLLQYLVVRDCEGRVLFRLEDFARGYPALATALRPAPGSLA